MKIGITAQGDNLEAQVELRFGRSPYFIVYDLETSDFEVVKNANVDAASGVGIQSGQLMADKGVGVVLTGKVGPKAAKALEAASIQVVSVEDGLSVQEAIDQYQDGSVTLTRDNNTARSQTTFQSQGVGVGGRGRGAGLGRGRGMGQGRGRGIGCGLGRGQGGGRRGFAGPGGFCICPNCGEKVEHLPSVPCRSNKCPKCGTVMIREN